jgi:uncharacterized protein (TIGR02145 family)
MKLMIVISFLIISFNPINCFSQTKYTFVGNGSWEDPANWLGNIKPPNRLPYGDEIIIDPANDGVCILLFSQSVSLGAKMTVMPGKKLLVIGSMVQDSPEFTDTRDGQKYPYIKIGTQTWMTKNLNFDTVGSWCYNDSAKYCNIYGRMYTWETALKVAPVGWHLPSDSEWTVLENYLGGTYVAGGKMKETTVWQEPNAGASNISGFSALPGGESNGGYNIYPRTYAGWGYYSFWWSSTIGYSGYVDGPLYRRLSYNSQATDSWLDYDGNAYYVRCVKD